MSKLPFFDLWEDFISDKQIMENSNYNTETVNGFSRKIGRTHSLVDFCIREDSNETIKDKTKKLILEEAVGNKSA